MNKVDIKVSEQQLAHMGGGVLAYIREIETTEAKKLLGGNTQFPADVKLYCLHNADGSPISISATREGAVGDALEHDLIPASVH
jgi:hypothetical protein